MRKLVNPKIGVLLLLMLAVVSLGALGRPAGAQEASRLFPQTGHTVRGRFLQYWDTHGGLAQQGYPISDELREVSPTDGKEYTVQYFERAVFELHPENVPPYDVLLSLLGVGEYRLTYGSGNALDQRVSTDNPRAFATTNHSIGGKFRAYWESHGGLAQQGYPISDEFTNYSSLDGKAYTVQYFERAVFELHQENTSTPYEILLSQLGLFSYRDRYQPPRQAVRLRPGTRQYGTAASADYLVWTESAAQPPFDKDTLFARDLRTGQVITMTDAPSVQNEPAIAGSLVVWSSDPCCGLHDILGKDLATGRTFDVAIGPADQTEPAIAGRTVAWIQAYEAAQQIMIKDLDSGATNVVATLAVTETTFSRPALSEEYLVWAEQAPSQHGRFPATPIRALNRRTGEIRTVATAEPSGPGYLYTEYALADHRLVWRDRQLHYTDLTTGATRVLVEQGLFNNPQIMGDTVVWSPGSIWGLHLSDGVARILVAGRGYKSGAVIAGDLLAWSNESGPFNGRVTFASLAAAFAGSTLPPPPPTPAPQGTAPPPPSPMPQFTETAEPGSYPTATFALPGALPTGTALPVTSTPSAP